VNWQERMEAAIDYIERNLGKEIDCKRVAAEANCSTFHYLRMFDVVTGITLGEYVRRRRLSIAALALTGTKEEVRVTDLALRSGYDSPDAFARAFKREFGITPSEARREGANLRTWPRITFSVVLKGDVSMEYRIEKKESFTLTGLPLSVSTENGENWRVIPDFWRKQHKNGNVKKLEKLVPKESKFGVMGVCDCSDANAKDFTFLIAIESSGSKAEQRKELPSGCIDIEAPSATWAVFPSHGPLPQAIQNVWKRIFSEWFPTSGYEHADGPELEIYDNSLSDDDPDYYSEVWIPVKK
jgi:AraC family transcriptional regulator